MYICQYCWTKFIALGNRNEHEVSCELKPKIQRMVVMAEPKGREQTHLRYDLIPGSFKEELAKIFTEGVFKYGEKNWMNQSPDFYRDCLNHAQVHLDKFNDGDHSENQLAKVAWNVLAAQWYYTIGWKVIGHDKPTITLNMERYILIDQARKKAEASEADYTQREKQAGIQHD